MWQKSLIDLLLFSISTTLYGESCLVSNQIRLVQSDSITYSNAGRVEICLGGVWGTIAADSPLIPWSNKNAQVACLQLGFSGALNVILQSTIPISEQSNSVIQLSAVSCSGTEPTISDCSHSTSTQDLDHGFDAYIVCRPNTFTYSVVHPSGPQSGDTRLFGDTRNGYGAVQIYTLTLGWQGICPDSSWTNRDAATVCQDLGYSSGSVAAPVDAPVGPSGVVSPRQLYAANCPGRASDDIKDGVCSFLVESSPGDNCPFPLGRFAAVECGQVVEGSVRLIGGTHSQEGIVEIAYNGRWGMICDSQFSVIDTQSICRGLGFGDDNAEVIPASFRSSLLGSERNLRPIWLTELSCTSSDRNLPACVRDDDIIGFADCQSLSIAAVDCGTPNSRLTRGQIAGIVIGVFICVGVFAYILGQLQKLHRFKKATGTRGAQSRPVVRRTRSPVSDQSALVHEPESDVATLEIAEFSLEPSAPPSQVAHPQPPAPAVNVSIIHPPSFDSTAAPHTPSEEHQPSAPGPVLSISPPPSFDEASNYPTKSIDLPPPYPGPPGQRLDSYHTYWNDIDNQTSFSYPINSPWSHP